MLSPAPFTLPVHCAHCGGAVTIECDTGPQDSLSAGAGEEWFCPYCAALHYGFFPGPIAWVMKGHGDDTTG